jgi:hypothetical protein
MSRTHFYTIFAFFQKSSEVLATFLVLTVASMKMTVFWDVEAVLSGKKY